MPQEKKKKEKNKQEVDNGSIENEEIVFEKNENSMPVDKIKKVKEDLKLCLKEKRGYLEGWQRLKADFVNFKKEQDKARQNLTSFIKMDMATNLMPVLDSFEIAFTNKEAWGKVDKEWRVGVEYICNQLKDILTKEGLEEISPKIGDEFDHNKHNPVETLPISKKTEKDDTLAEIVSKGYYFCGKIIRPARVKVFADKKD